ncbi:unnamed protein product, partial [Rotaria sp. Silwood2]
LMAQLPFDRCESTMLGHAFADNFQALTDMALELSRSLQTCRKWGKITKTVYEELKSHIKNKSNNFTREDFKFPIKEIYNASRTVHENRHGLSSGCNPAQRSFPLALCPWIDDNNLFQVSCDEARLTHFSTTAGQVSGLTNLICRRLINGDEWNDAIKNAFLIAPDLLGEIREIQERYKHDDILNDTLNLSSPYVYAPNTLHTALYCITKANSFKNALENVHKLDIYHSPILVGILTGARWDVPKQMLRDSPEDKIKEIQKIAAKFSEH